MYIIKLLRIEGAYVFTTGTRADYTRDVALARRFDTIKEAKRHCCADSEIIIDLDTGKPI